MDRHIQINKHTNRTPPPPPPPNTHTQIFDQIALNIRLLGNNSITSTREQHHLQ